MLSCNGIQFTKAILHATTSRMRNCFLQVNSGQDLQLSELNIPERNSTSFNLYVKHSTMAQDVYFPKDWDESMRGQRTVLIPVPNLSGPFGSLMFLDCLEENWSSSL